MGLLSEFQGREKRLDEAVFLVLVHIGLHLTVLFLLVFLIDLAHLVNLNIVMLLGKLLRLRLIWQNLQMRNSMREFELVRGERGVVLGSLGFLRLEDREEPKFLLLPFQVTQLLPFLDQTYFSVNH